MKRFWLGVGILAALLVLGFWTAEKMDAVHMEIAGQLETAARQALGGDLSAGTKTALAAKKAWEKSWHGSATVADHAPMDELDGLLAQLEAYSRAGQTGDFAACCSRSALLVRAMSEAHSMTWWNLL